MTDEKKNNPRSHSNAFLHPDPEQLREQAEQKAKDMPLHDLDTMSREEIQQRFHELHAKQIEAELENEQLRCQLEERDNHAVLFRIVTEHMLDMVTLTDMEGNFTFAGNAHELLGYEPGFLIGKNVMDFVHTEDLPLIAAEFNESVASVLPRKVDYRYRCEDGSYLWLETVGNFIKDENGVPQKIIFNSRDITERKRAEEELRNAERHLRSTVDGLSAHIAVVDEHGEIILTNKAYRDFGERNGIEPHAVSEGTNYLAVCDTASGEYSEEAKPFAEGIREVLSGKRQSFELEYPCHSPDEKRWFIGRVTPFAGEGPRIVIIAHENITEQKRAEDRRQEGFDLLKKLARLVPGVIYQYRLYPDGRSAFPYSSPGMHDIYEVTPEEVREDASVIFGRIHPEDRDRVAEAIFESARTLNTFHCELRVILPKQGLRWRWSQAHPERTEDGGTLWHGIILDITERKQAEQALAESETRFKALHNASFGGIGIHDQGIILECNQGLSEMTGYQYSELIGMDGLLLIAERSREAVMNNIRTGYEKPYEAFGLRKNGEEFPLQLEARNVPYKGKQVRTVEFRDITERKRAEERLRISEEKYRNIFENMQDVYYETSLDGLILEISPSIEAISSGQYRQADLIGRQMLDFYDDAEERDRLITKLLETGSFSDFEILLRNRDGSLLPCSISAKLWRDDQGNPVKIIGSMRDITDRKKAGAEREKLQAQLTQAQKMESVGRLAGGVAHDYNNMLSVILGYTEMAMDQVDPKDQLYADLMEVYNAGKRSMDITRQLLAFARKQIISPVVMDLNEAVDGMLKMLRRLIGEDIDFAWEPAIRLWPVNMDPSQIDQILANLCVNAKDAISGVGKITIETENITLDESYCAEHAGFIPGDFVMLAVSDNGCGMDKETMEQIFEPFFTTKEVGKGTGLGLPMIYGIVKQNNGFINCYSEPGKGTTFRIYLPRHTIETDEAITEVSHEEVAFGQGETLLLVEDEPAIIKMCQTMLEKLGYNVLIAHAPDAAVNLASEHSGIIHLLMSDVVMPGMNGRDLADKLKAIRPGIRVLFMSGYTANAIVHHGVLDEGEHFIQKPFSMKKLSVKVRKALEGGKSS
ncbi:MAG: PAS domain S-box protein [Desulfobacteraceae bacterium]|nr:MAG: PAS domain S-box protein [Desulfobacteraceae bacterium]